MKHPRATLPTLESTASFWHSEPSPFLLGHRTTPHLPSSADIVIVGSGLTGSAVARFLAEDERASGKSIVMVEAREACWGATGRNGGHCQPLLFDREPDVAAFEIKNVETVCSFIKDNNVPCEWRDVSGCRTFWTEDLMAATELEIADLAKRAPEIAKRVEVVRDRRRLDEHRVGPDCAGATITEGAGSLWPYKLVSFVLEELVKGGKLNLQTMTPVTDIGRVFRAEDLNFKKLTRATEIGERCSGDPRLKWSLNTPRGNIETNTVILATNAYTSALLPDFADLIVPVRGEMSALLPPKGSSLIPNSYGMVGALNQPANNDDYLVQRPSSGVPNPASHLMFGGGRGAGVLNSMGVSDDSVVDPGAASYLRKALLKVLKLDGETEGLEELTATAEWTGIMGYSRDNHPWVGEIPDQKGIWLCGGYTGHGMPNGTLCGKAVARMVLADEEDEKSVEKLKSEMVDAGELPKGYLITKERIAEARRLATVEVQDKEGTLGLGRILR